MEVFRGAGEVPPGWGPSVVAIGNFDGVHRGHLSILGDVCERARVRGARAVVVTFDPHPVRLLYPERAPKLITPLEERLRLLGALPGLDAALVLPFTKEFAAWTPEQFAEEVLSRALGAIEVHEGDSFRFGAGAQAGMAELRVIGERLGFAALSHPVLTVRGLTCSSSEVRRLVASGDVSRARALLGRVFAIEATQRRDRGVGGKLLVPTINLAPYDELLPANGVYATRMEVGERCFDAVTNAGERPTFEGASYAVETYLLDYDAEREPLELTPETRLRLSFLKHLREERRFPSPEELRAQIGRDVAQARRFLRLAARVGPIASDRLS